MVSFILLIQLSFSSSLFIELSPSFWEESLHVSRCIFLCMVRVNAPFLEREFRKIKVHKTDKNSHTKHVSFAKFAFVGELQLLSGTPLILHLLFIFDAENSIKLI